MPELNPSSGDEMYEYVTGFAKTNQGGIKETPKVMKTAEDEGLTGVSAEAKIMQEELAQVDPEQERPSPLENGKKFLTTALTRTRDEVGMLVGGGDLITNLGKLSGLIGGGLMLYLREATIAGENTPMIDPQQAILYQGFLAAWFFGFTAMASFIGREHELKKREDEGWGEK